MDVREKLVEIMEDLGCNDEYCKECKCNEPLTNADRIRAMSDEELRNWLFQRDCANIAAFLVYGGMGVMNAVQLLEWLQQPTKGE